MAVVGLKFLACFFMTLQTDGHAYLVCPLVTGSTSFNIWLVEEISKQSLAVTAMGVVTGEAVFEGQGVILVGCLQGLCAVA